MARRLLQIHGREIHGFNVMALEFARTANCDPLEVLRPKGKSLEQVFSAQIKTALKKSGDRKVVQDVLAALVVLPRPIPVTEIAAYCGNVPRASKGNLP